MSSAVKIFQGRFGRVALLDMDAPLVGHAHHHCHILIKAGGQSTPNRPQPASKDRFKRIGRCVSPRFCRVRAAMGKEKGRLKSLSSCALTGTASGDQTADGRE